MWWFTQISCILSVLAISFADGSKLGPSKNIASLSKNLVIFLPGGLWTMIADFIILGSKITADGDCSHEIKRHLLFGRKAMTNLDSILKRRYIILPTNVHLVKATVFTVVLYGCESGPRRKLSTKRLILLNCGVGEDSWWSLGLEGDPASPSERRSVLNIH